MDAFYGILTAIQLIAAVVLIALVMLQTTKSEGLTGTIGGKMSASFRGKPGIEDRLSDLTKWSAIFFMVATLLVYVIGTKVGV